MKFSASGRKRSEEGNFADGKSENLREATTRKIVGDRNRDTYHYR
jgi:hypothetical protein